MGANPTDWREKQAAFQLNIAKQREATANAALALADRLFEEAKNSVGESMRGQIAEALEKAEELQREEDEARAAEKVRNKEVAEMHAAKNDLISERMALKDAEQKYAQVLEDYDNNEESPT